VHNNFYFLRQLSPVLDRAIRGFTLVSCFSQNKEELVLEFNNSKSSFFLKASLTSAFCCLSFPNTFSRARKNTVDLFPAVILKKVVTVRQFENERSFSIALEDDWHLLFKMHGNRANVVLLNGDKPVELFRNHLKADAALRLGELDRSLDWSREYFDAHQHDLKETYFTFGKEVWRYLRQRGFDDADTGKRWDLLLETRTTLEHPQFYIFEREEKPVFSLLPGTDPVHSFSDPIEAVTRFYVQFTGTYFLYVEKSAARRGLESQLAAGMNYIEKNKLKIIELVPDTHYQQWADLIMANLQRITPGMEKISVENFYDHNRPVEIKLKKELNAQRNAGVLYRKAKNQVIEIQKLHESIAIKEKEIESIKEKIASIKNESELRNIRKIMEKPGAAKNAKEKQNSPIPYHEFEYKGFKIWVGKNAVSNDTLTLHHAFKDDLWLHAKDVAGSHVLIKHQAGKPFPKDVIERAAELAAFYSKRKKEHLCPVAVTPKKYVRKRKGDPAGAVVVEREEVILVTPSR
jgi:predicted ribosome quality control (RQC) complex YloA/Tae2 family protein